MAKRTLLIDADVVAFAAASSCETIVEFVPGYYTWHVDLAETKVKADLLIEQWMDSLNADAVKLCLTDPKHNFRKDILPTYKGNRANLKRPLVLFHLKDWMVEERGAVLVDGLEGDDVMGIFATSPHRGERIICSIDKDMKTIPSLYCRSPEEGVVEVTEAQADAYHLMQTLTGDATDGYSGCPAVGPKKAEAIIKPDASLSENWEAVIAAYAKAGLGPEEALVQARVARILRSSEFDLANRKPILWTPPVN